jgi:hypothetical protein
MNNLSGFMHKCKPPSFPPSVPSPPSLPCPFFALGPALSALLSKYKHEYLLRYKCE